MVDVIDSAVVKDKESALGLIKELINNAKDQTLRSYVEAESGQPFDAKVGILVQDFCGHIRGSIVEQPSDRGIYRVVTMVDKDRHSQPVHLNQFFDDDARQIDRTSFDFEGKNGKPISEEYYVTQDELKDTSGLHAIQFREHLPAVIGLYRSIRDAGLVPEDHSFQMEFGLDKENPSVPKLFQARVFRPFQLRPAFQIDYGFYGSGYGVTPKEGVVLDVHDIKSTATPNVPHARFQGETYGRSLPLDIQPREMAAYLCGFRNDVLEHGDFRWLQKAHLVAFKTPVDEDVLRRGNAVRVCVKCDGIRSDVTLLK